MSRIVPTVQFLRTYTGPFRHSKSRINLIIKKSSVYSLPSSKSATCRIKNDSLVMGSKFRPHEEGLRERSGALEKYKNQSMSHDLEEQLQGHEGEIAGNHMSQVVQPEKDHFPLCIVWMPLPVLTWLIPFVGHVGIATSDGTIHDFVGSHYINVCLH